MLINEKKKLGLDESRIFLVGDLVLFFGYELNYSPLTNKIGIVISLPIKGRGWSEVLWLHNEEKMLVSNKHLQHAYIIKDKSQTSK